MEFFEISEIVIQFFDSLQKRIYIISELAVMFMNEFGFELNLAILQIKIQFYFFRNSSRSVNSAHCLSNPNLYVACSLLFTSRKII